MTDEKTTLSFAELGLPAPLLKALHSVGYETPSPIQAASIPALMTGRDIIGQAQTGTGKTAAFALPMLANIDQSAKHPQALILTPTRELAIQVAEAFQSYARFMKDFHVLPIYGGQDMSTQLKQLRRGVQVIVGTPGRVLDHLRRKSLILSDIKFLVLDEADEMLRMGFIDDVETILSHITGNKQTALFSATLPGPIRKVANRFLENPEHIHIKGQNVTVDTIDQRFWMVNQQQKIDALTRLLEFEEIEAAIIFVRTRETTTQLAEKISARGHSCAAINGDMSQSQREKTIRQLKEGRIDILVATDVAARGLDVERISHVVNYDIPYDSEAYVHRIGRTGRAGRSGHAVLFVTPREQHLLRSIERTTGQRISRIALPSPEDITNQRIQRFKQKINEAIPNTPKQFFDSLIVNLCNEMGETPESLAATLAFLLQESRPLQAPPEPKEKPRKDKFAKEGSRKERPTKDRFNKERGGKDRPEKTQKNRDKSAHERPVRNSLDRHDRNGKSISEGSKDRRPTEEVAQDRAERRPRRREIPTVPLELYRLEVGSSHAVTPGDIVGAIANEAGVDSQYFGRIDIQENFSTVELPEGMPKDVLKHLKKVWVRNQKLNISRIGETAKPKSAKPNFKKAEAGKAGTTKKISEPRSKKAVRPKK